MNIQIKNSKRIGLLGAALLLVAYSCSDEFLQDPNTRDLLESDVYEADITAIAAVTGVYEGLQNDSQGDPGLPNEYNVKGVFRMANNITLDWQDSGKRGESEYDQLNLSPDGDVSVKIWPNNYRVIGRANNVLFNLKPAIEIGNVSADIGNKLIGEVLVIRAISYQYLAAIYGGVPLQLLPSDDPVNGDDQFKARDTQDAVFQQIVTDMEDAITKLPWVQEEKGRVSKGTAYAVLGNAHMWLGQYDKAITAFEAIETGGATSLEPKYLNIHALANPNGVESLFEIQWAANGDLGWNRNDEVNILQLFAMPTDITGGGGFAGIPRKELYDSFEPGDLRRQATVIAPGEEHPDPLINISQYKVGVWTGEFDSEDKPIFAVDGNEKTIYLNTLGTVEDPWTGAGLGKPESVERTGYWGIKSWRDPNIDGWGRPKLFGGQGHIWIRYGEVLLSLAEAYHKNGNDGKAMENVMRVRNRAWGGGAPTPTGAMMDIILEEYRHELGGEFSLWPAIRRSGEATRYIQERYGLTMPAGHELVPIPNSELSINPNLKQNPGY